MQKRCNSSALAMELCLFCIKPLNYKGPHSCVHYVLALQFVGPGLTTVCFPNIRILEIRHVYVKTEFYITEVYIIQDKRCHKTLFIMMSHEMCWYLNAITPSHPSLSLFSSGRNAVLWFHFDNIQYMHFVCLTHWGRDKMDAISQTTFLNAFSWMKMFEYRLKLHWSLFLRVQLTISQHWFW